MSKAYVDEYNKWFGEATFDEEEIQRIQSAHENNLITPKSH